MVTKDIIIRIQVSTLNKIRRIIRPRQFETLKDYMDRVLQEVLNNEN